MPRIAEDIRAIKTFKKDVYDETSRLLEIKELLDGVSTEVEEPNIYNPPLKEFLECVDDINDRSISQLEGMQRVIDETDTYPDAQGGPDFSPTEEMRMSDLSCIFPVYPDTGLFPGGGWGNPDVEASYRGPILKRSTQKDRAVAYATAHGGLWWEVVLSAPWSDGTAGYFVAQALEAMPARVVYHRTCCFGYEAESNFSLFCKSYNQGTIYNYDKVRCWWPFLTVFARLIPDSGYPQFDWSLVSELLPGLTAYTRDYMHNWEGIPVYDQFFCSVWAARDAEYDSDGCTYYPSGFNENWYHQNRAYGWLHPYAGDGLEEYISHPSYSWVLPTGSKEVIKIFPYYAGNITLQPGGSVGGAIALYSLLGILSGTWVFGPFYVDGERFQVDGEEFYTRY